MTLLDLIALWFLGQGLPAELPPAPPAAVRYSACPEVPYGP